MNIQGQERPSVTTALVSGCSLIDILNQQSPQVTSQYDQTTVRINETNTYDVQHSQKSETNDNERLSTLFNPTGRERNATGPLKQWLYEHQDHPYPTESDRQELMEKTNMSAAQITIWFTNARVKMRKEKKLQSNTSAKKIVKKQDNEPNHLEGIQTLPVTYVGERPKLNVHTPILSNEKRMVIAFSSLTNQEILQLKCLVSMFPNRLSISQCVDDCTTHLVIGLEKQPLLCPLTMKLFYAMTRHLYIITFRWITDCIKQNRIIDETNYEVRGDIPFGKYHDGMRKSRLSKNTKLFQNCQFHILCDGCQRYMSKSQLAELIQQCHGSLLDSFPLTATADNSSLTIVICNELDQFDSPAQKLLFELSRSNGVHFLSPEWVFESIVQFVLQPFDLYEEEF